MFGELVMWEFRCRGKSIHALLVIVCILVKLVERKWFSGKNFGLGPDHPQQRAKTETKACLMWRRKDNPCWLLAGGVPLNSEGSSAIIRGTVPVRAFRNESVGVLPQKRAGIEGGSGEVQNDGDNDGNDDDVGETKNVVTESPFLTSANSNCRYLNRQNDAAVLDF